GGEKGGEYWEGEGGGSEAQNAICRNRSRQKTVASRRQTRVIDSAVIGGMAPVLIGSFKLELIPKRFARLEAESEKIDLNVVLIRAERQFRDIVRPQLGYRLRETGVAQPPYLHGWRRLWVIRLRGKPR